MARIKVGLSILLAAAMLLMSLFMRCHTHHCSGELCQITISQLFSHSDTEECPHHQDTHHHDCNDACIDTLSTSSADSQLSNQFDLQHIDTYASLFDNSLCLISAELSLPTPLCQNNKTHLSIGYNSIRAPRGIPVIS